MKNLNEMNRRKFVKITTGVLATSPLLLTSTSSAQDLPIITEADPLALALSYKEDTTTVDTTKFPNHANEQLCSNCAMYTGELDAEHGPCLIFPGKSVTANGWCSVWAEKPAA